MSTERIIAVTTYEQALLHLEATADLSDDFIVSMYSVKVAYLKSFLSHVINSLLTRLNVKVDEALFADCILHFNRSTSHPRTHLWHATPLP